MSDDFLEQLADIEIREPPPEFDRQLHAKVNRSLVVQHLLDFAVRAFPWAMFHFARGVAGLVVFSITGKFHHPDGKENRDSL
jgi:hypothetical protein